MGLLQSGDGVLRDDSRLIPAQPPRRTLLHFQGAPDPTESTITAVVSDDKRHVIWRDFRECMAGGADDYDSGGLLFILEPPGSAALSVPDLVFDREQYLAEVHRAIADREWESDGWRTAQLLDDYVGAAIRLDPWSEEFNTAYAEPADHQGSGFLLTLWDNYVRRGIVVTLTAGPGTPEQRARSMADALMSTPRDQWPIVRRMERSE